MAVQGQGQLVLPVLHPHQDRHVGLERLPRDVLIDRVRRKGPAPRDEERGPSRFSRGVPERVGQGPTCGARAAAKPSRVARRARIVEATDDGRRVLDAARDDVRAIEDSLLSDLEPAARQALRTALGRLVHAPVTRIEDGRAYDDACAPRQA
ncbi:hypothetical protein [Streptomyces sp. NPDC085466]|uniref:hypothetical protein n=1 Tax=Streptomyces sp. NPDC085466 TaxID=3365725 RepID=UPI0037D7B762